MRIISNTLTSSFSGATAEFTCEHTGVGALGFDFTSAAMAGDIEELYTVLDEIKLSAAYVRKNGPQVTICSRLSLLQLAVFGASSEGAIATTSTINRVSFVVPLSEMGGIQMLDDETLTFTLNGLPTTAGLRMSVYGMESPVADPVMFVYNQKSVPAGTISKTFDLTPSAFLILPVTNSLDSLQITYANGQDVTLTPAELFLHHSTRQDLVTIAPTNVDQIGPYYVLQVEAAATLRVNSTGTLYNFTAVDPTVINSVANVQAQNAPLASTVDNNLITQANNQ